MFGQAFGGGGGGGFQQFQFGGDGGGLFGGGDPRRQRQAPKWPKGTPQEPSKKFAFMKGTEWSWNNWRNVKFAKDGTFEAPTRDCQGGQCKWSSSDQKSKIYILWGDSGLHELSIEGKIPEKQDATSMKNLKMKGVRLADRDACSAAFVKVFDHEAADLDKDLYGTLGIEEDADDATIKKVYKKLSLKYHPDKAGNDNDEARQMFNDVRDAYEILNNAEKKILYDTGGMEAVKELDKGQVQRGDDIGHGLEVTLEELYNSGVKKAGLERRVVCRGCLAKPSMPKCAGCGRCPNEVRMVNRQVGPGMVIQQQEEVASKEKCKQEKTTIEVTIEKGMRTGEKITFPLMAEQRPGMLPGSVIFDLKTKKHAKFERRGDDLHLPMRITLREALLGWSQTIRHLNGHKVTISTNSVTKPFQVFKVKGEGMPQREDSASYGDLYVKVEIDFPKDLNDDQYTEVERIFISDPPKQEL